VRIVFLALKLLFQLELGPEFDSNANRVEVNNNGQQPIDQPVASPLLRATSRLKLAWRSGISTLTVSAGLGGKLFFLPAAFDDSVLVLQAGVEERVQLPRSFWLSLSGDYYDAFQESSLSTCGPPCMRQRDFRAGSLIARLFYAGALGTLGIGGGYRGFDFKPDASLSFQSAELDASAQTVVTRGNHEVTLAWSYHLERRFYSALVQINPYCPPWEPLVDGCLVEGSESRADWFHEGRFDITYLGPVLVGTGYGLQIDLSNSYAQSLLRHVITFRFATRLFWNIYGTLKAQLLINKYLQAVPLDFMGSTMTFVSIEDENRNAIIVDLERPVGRGVAINLRYSFFTNELTSNLPVSFIRHVAYAGIIYQYSLTRR
jgi:hypothetical protein